MSWTASARGLADCSVRMRRVSPWSEGAGVHPGGVLCAKGLGSAACRLFQNILWSAVSAEVHALAGSHCAEGQALHASYHIQWGEPLTPPAGLCPGLLAMPATPST